MNPRAEAARRHAAGQYAGFVMAWSWLTRLPWPGRFPQSTATLADALWAFPLVGAMVGAAGGAVYAVALHWNAGSSLAAAAAIATIVLFSGGLHEDGFGDFCDGLAARGDPGQRIAAMRDPRLGAFGVLGLTIVLLLRAGALVGLAGPAAIWSLVIAAAGGRSAIGLVMLRIPPATENGSGAAAGRASMGPVAVGLALCAVLLLAGSWAMELGPVAILATVTVVAGGPFVVARTARRRFGGYTGDILGASSVVVETAALIVLASAAR